MIETELELRVKSVNLHPSIGKEHSYSSLNVSFVSALECKKPKDRDRISWVFTTNLPVSSKTEAVTVLDWYRQRWKIETYFKVLKSGFKAESSKLRTSGRLTRLISIFCILAWKVQWITTLNRDHEGYAPNASFDETERKVLRRYFKRQDSPPRTLQDYINLVARLGGYLDRSSDPPPGISAIWRGMSRLYDLRIGFELVGN